MRLKGKKRIVKKVTGVSLITAACIIGAVGGHTGNVKKASAERYTLKAPIVNNDVTTWDCVWFGHYLQEDSNGDGLIDQKDEKKVIKWRVLSVDNGEALLLADKNLDAKRYNDTSGEVSWQTSTVRSWLNGYGSDSNQNKVDYSADNSFVSQAFTAVERSEIIEEGEVNGNEVNDKVFFLSCSDVMNGLYGFSTGNAISPTREAKNTDYARAQGIQSSDAYDENGCWWLKDSFSGVARYVAESGVCDGLKNVETINHAVRPALRVSLSSIRLKYAGIVRSNGEELEPSEDGELAEHLFTDREYEENVNTTEGIQLFANGLSSKDKNFRTATVYTDITPSYRYWDSKGKEKTATGKVIVGITTSDTEPEVEKNKIVDKDAAKIAKASIKNGKVTVTAKSQEGEVFLWIVDTGDKAVTECCPVYVKAAPTAVYAYDTPVIEYGKTAKCTKKEVEVGEPAKIYLYPVYKLNGEMVKTGDATYTVTVSDSVKDYFTATMSGDEVIVSAKSLKSNKKTTGKITIRCDQSGKKVDITLTAVNKVRKIELSDPVNLVAGEKADTFQVTAMPKTKVTGSIDVKTTLSSGDFLMTDKGKLYVMGSENGFNSEKMEKGTVSIVSKPSTKQKQVSATLSGSRITVSVAKGAQAGNTTYFLLVYNTDKGTDKIGYKVFSVTVV